MASDLNAVLSPFGGLWTDRPDAAEQIEARVHRGEVTAEEATLLRQWLRTGVMILERAVEPSLLDALNRQIDRIWRTGDDRYKVEIGYMRYASPGQTSRDVGGHRLIDLYVGSEEAREAIFSYRVARLLRILFGGDALAFQSLTFEKGSQQDMHQDPVYVVVSSPRELAAAWIALEDVQPGSGELEYYEGSHRLPDFVFGGSFKSWNPDRDGLDMHHAYQASLREEATKRGLVRRKFSPMKGDVLIWHADLAHGGARISHPDPQVTRKSLVAHYCPLGVEPQFFSRPDRRTIRRFKDGCYYCSKHYAIEEGMAEVTSQQGARPARVSTPLPPGPLDRGFLLALKPWVKPWIPQQLRSWVRWCLGDP